jgi:hypothetical protein
MLFGHAVGFLYLLKTIGGPSDNIVGGNSESSLAEDDGDFVVRSWFRSREDERPSTAHRILRWTGETRAGRSNAEILEPFLGFVGRDLRFHDPAT